MAKPMFSKPDTKRSVQRFGLGDGEQRLWMFPNGYGASVIRHGGSYGGPEGKWELAVTHDVKRNAPHRDRADLCYSTPITNDVEGWLTPEEVTALLRRIADLPMVDVCSHAYQADAIDEEESRLPAIRREEAATQEMVERGCTHE